MKSVYIETSVISYLAARASRNLIAAAWQQVTADWWRTERSRYEILTSELVVAEARAGDKEIAGRRLELLKGIPELVIDDQVRELAARLLKDVLPAQAKADALHIAVAAVHEVDYLLTWNCRHIDNASMKPVVRSVCVVAGYQCPEICTPLELRGRQP